MQTVETTVQWPLIEGTVAMLEGWTDLLQFSLTVYRQLPNLFLSSSIFVSSFQDWIGRLYVEHILSYIFIVYCM